MSILNRAATLLITLFLVLFIAGGCDLNLSSITIEGEGVEAAVELTLKDLKGLEEYIVEDEYFSVNSYGTEEYFHFKGVWVWAVLEEFASLKEDAATVSFIADDGYTVDYTLEEVRRDDYIDQNNPDTRYKMIIAWEESHEEYNPEEGNPFRLVVGQKEPGDVNKPYWVSRIETIRVD